MVSAGKYGENNIILAKPQTFMNLSGEALSAAKKYFIRGFTSNSLIVVHDEIDLPLGSFRISADSSSAGHKGVQNIIDILGTKNFTRLRIGVDNRGDKEIATEKYVLGKFLPAELKLANKVISESSEEIKQLISNS
ncbi:MAG TPA: aminoacyl-tRNA hydrolase [Candidatus Moranbacteria bacterium]|nr:aminoacyl-tRNA hydrolase [Candidatus Moranbacteria bacterium]